MVDAYDPNFDIIGGWAETTAKESTSQGIKLKHMIAIQQMQYAEGSYSADWSTVSLPSTSSGGKHCIRVNTDDSNVMRLYSWNAVSNSWVVVASTAFTVPEAHVGLSGKNDEADIQHLTAAEVAALHDIFVLTKGDVDALAITELGTVTVGNIDAIANYIANTDTQLTTEEVQDIAGPLVATGGTKTRISVVYDDPNGNMDFIVDDMNQVAGDFNHNDLANIDAGDINHITDLQLAALHDIYVLTKANVDALLITSLGTVTVGNIDAIANYIANTDTQLTDEEVEDIAGPLVATGGTKTRISVVYDDPNGNIDFIVDDMNNVAGDFNHNDLANLNAGTSYEHLTQTEKDKIHDIYVLTKANVDALGITSLGTVTVGNIDAIANYIANTDVSWNASTVSQAEAEAGTVTTDRKWTAQRVRQSTAEYVDITHSEQVKAGFSVHGGGTVSVDGSFRCNWTSRLIVISNGRGSHFGTAGYFDINRPTSGTITVVGGGTANVWNASGIVVPDWQALYYILPIGSSQTSIDANFRMVGYTVDLEIPDHWIRIVGHNGDSDSFRWGHGIILNDGDTWIAGTDGDAPSGGGGGDDESNMKGSGNSAWVPCAMDIDSQTTSQLRGFGFGTVGHGWALIGTVDPYVNFHVPISTNKGSLKLYIKGIRLQIYDADSNDYITNLDLVGQNHNGQVVLQDGGATQYTSAGEHDVTFTAVDCSSQSITKVKFQMVSASSTQLVITGILVDAYYDT